MSFEKLVKQFNENPSESFLRPFGGPDEPIHEILPRFLGLMEKKGLYDDLEIYKLLANHYYLTNSYFLFKFKSEKRRPELIEGFSHMYRDIKYVDGKVYLVLDKFEDLSEFFCDRDGGRRDISSKELVEGVFGGDWWGPHSNTTYNVFQDVIEVLDNNNLNYLSQKIAEKLKRINLENVEERFYETFFYETFSEIASEQGNYNYITVTPEIVRNMITIKPYFDFLSEQLGDDFHYSLASTHNQAYNDAINDKQYSKILSELEKLGISEGEYIEHGKYVTEITSFFERVLEVFLEEFNGYAEDPSEFSTFTDLFYRIQDISPIINCLKVSLVEHVDYRIVQKIINNIFKDNLYF
jgi:hypothetical protein